MDKDKDKDKEYSIEANKITAYLISEPLQVQERMRYILAMHQYNIQLSACNESLLSEMLKSTWKMACIDGGLAILDAENLLRRKIFTMLAILEASPNYTTYFLSRKYSFLDYIHIIYVGIRAVIRAVIGIIIIKNIQSKCN